MKVSQFVELKSCCNVITTLSYLKLGTVGLSKQPGGSRIGGAVVAEGVVDATEPVPVVVGRPKETPRFAVADWGTRNACAAGSPSDQERKTSPFCGDATSTLIKAPRKTFKVEGRSVACP